MPNPPFGRNENANAVDGAALATGMPNLSPLFSAGDRLIQSWIAISNEMFEFGRKSMQEVADTSVAMAKTANLSEAVALQAGFARSLLEDGFQRAGKIADLGVNGVVGGILESVPAPHRPAEKPTPQRARASE